MEEVFVNYYKHTRLITYKREYYPIKKYSTYSAEDRCDSYPFLDHICLSGCGPRQACGPRPCKVFIRKTHPAEKFIEKHHSLYARFKYLHRRKLNTKDLPYPSFPDDVKKEDWIIDEGYQELKPIGDDYNLYTYFARMF